MNSVDDSIGKVVRKQCTENAKERCTDETAASATDLSIRWAERFTADRASAPFKNQQIDSLQKKNSPPTWTGEERDSQGLAAFVLEGVNSKLDVSDQAVAPRLCRRRSPVRTTVIVVRAGKVSDRKLPQREEAPSSGFRRCRSDGWSCFLWRGNRSRSFGGNTWSGTSWFTAGSATGVVAAGYPFANALFTDFLRRFFRNFDATAFWAVAHTESCSQPRQEPARVAGVAAASSASTGWSTSAASSTFGSTFSSTFSVCSAIASADSVTRAGFPGKASRRDADRFRFDVVAGCFDVDFLDDRFAAWQTVSSGAAASGLAAVVGHRDRRHGYAD